MEAPLDAATGAAPALGRRTRSAHDLGAGFGAGVEEVSSACWPSAAGTIACSEVIGAVRVAL